MEMTPVTPQEMSSVFASLVAPGTAQASGTVLPGGQPFAGLLQGLLPADQAAVVSGPSISEAFSPQGAAQTSQGKAATPARQGAPARTTGGMAGQAPVSPLVRLLTTLVKPEAAPNADAPAAEIGEKCSIERPLAHDAGSCDDEIDGVIPSAPQIDAALQQVLAVCVPVPGMPAAPAENGPPAAEVATATVAGRSGAVPLQDDFSVRRDAYQPALQRQVGVQTQTAAIRTTEKQTIPPADSVPPQQSLAAAAVGAPDASTALHRQTGAAMVRNPAQTVGMKPAGRAETVVPDTPAVLTAPDTPALPSAPVMTDSQIRHSTITSPVNHSLQATPATRGVPIIPADPGSQNQPVVSDAGATPAVNAGLAMPTALAKPAHQALQTDTNTTPQKAAAAPVNRARQIVPASLPSSAGHAVPAAQDMSTGIADAAGQGRFNEVPDVISVPAPSVSGGAVPVPVQTVPAAAAEVPGSGDGIAARSPETVMADLGATATQRDKPVMATASAVAGSPAPVAGDAVKTAAAIPVSSGHAEPLPGVPATKTGRYPAHSGGLTRHHEGYGELEKISSGTSADGAAEVSRLAAPAFAGRVKESTPGAMMQGGYDREERGTAPKRGEINLQSGVISGIAPDQPVSARFLLNPRAEAAESRLHSHILEQVTSSIMTHDGKGNGAITVKLNPLELGELQIQVRIENQNVKVEIITDNRTVREALMGHMESLKETFQKQNLTMERFDVSTGGGGFSQGAREERGEQQRTPSVSLSAETPRVRAGQDMVDDEALEAGSSLVNLRL